MRYSMARTYDVNARDRHIVVSNLSPKDHNDTARQPLYRFTNPLTPMIDNTTNTLEIALLGLDFDNLHTLKNCTYAVSTDVVKEYQYGMGECNIIGQFNTYRSDSDHILPQLRAGSNSHIEGQRLVAWAIQALGNTTIASFDAAANRSLSMRRRF